MPPLANGAPMTRSSILAPVVVVTAWLVSPTPATENPAWSPEATPVNWTPGWPLTWPTAREVDRAGQGQAGAGEHVDVARGGLAVDRRPGGADGDAVGPAAVDVADPGDRTAGPPRGLGAVDEGDDVQAGALGGVVEVDRLETRGEVEQVTAGVDQVGAAGAGVLEVGVAAARRPDQERALAVDRAGGGDRRPELRGGLLAGDELEARERVARVAGDRVVLARRGVAQLGEVADPLVAGLAGAGQVPGPRLGDGQPVRDRAGVGRRRPEDQVDGRVVAHAQVGLTVLGNGGPADEEVVVTRPGEVADVGDAPARTPARRRARQLDAVGGRGDRRVQGRDRDGLARQFDRRDRGRRQQARDSSLWITGRYAPRRRATNDRGSRLPNSIGDSLLQTRPVARPPARPDRAVTRPAQPRRSPDRPRPATRDPRPEPDPVRLGLPARRQGVPYSLCNFGPPDAPTPSKPRRRAHYREPRQGHSVQPAQSLCPISSAETIRPPPPWARVDLRPPAARVG